MAEIFQASGPNSVGRIMCLLYIAYGVVWIFIIGFEGVGLLYALLGGPFIIFGLLWLLRDTPRVRLIFGVVGAIGTFYSAISWSNTIGVEAGSLMTVYSIALLALSLGIICSSTCSWPDEQQYGM
ncbi:MAG: hypothetical protein P1Q69_20905 [Candidatus Thorarchaeota archaeon]|nr:hypothetical protein [Candidatus Thorarchaeota archaeon]